MRELSDEETEKILSELLSGKTFMTRFSAEEADRLGIAKMSKNPPTPEEMERYYSEVNGDDEELEN